MAAAASRPLVSISDEVQSVVRPIKKDLKRAPKKRHPLKKLNTNCVLRMTARRMALLAQRAKAKKKRTNNSKEDSAAITAAGEAWYQTMICDSDSTEFDVFKKWLGVSQ